jgi:hypothetical protein
MTMHRHEPYDELMSASLTGDLTADERRRLDLHLAGCASCRATLAAFADQRSIVAGLRSIAPPRDLGARVRTGIEIGTFDPIPWWRRPAAIFAGVGGGLAVVAGALLALVLLNGGPADPEVGRQSQTPSPQPSLIATPSPGATVPPILPPPPASLAPGQTAAPTPSVEETPQPSSTASPEPDVYLAYTGPADGMELTVVDGSTGDPVTEAGTPSGEPIVAELSPDGQWLAYITRVGESGLTEVRATRIADTSQAGGDAMLVVDSDVPVGETVVLGESVEGTPFLERLAWSSDSRHLAYTLAHPDDSGTDAYIFDVSVDEPYAVTDTGSAYAGSWSPGDVGTSLLWISVAGEAPVSYLQAFREDAEPMNEPIDPAENAVATAEGVFLPLLSPNGRLAIYWTGRMERSGAGWHFVEAGAPYLSEHPLEGEEPYRFTNERPLFSDVTIMREAFSSAAIAWGPDGDAYAVWNTVWTGIPQSDDGSPYPDSERVYFGHATDSRGLTRSHAIDAADIPADTVVVDVKASPTGRHLAITVQEPTGGILESPRAYLLLVERNTGEVDDEVTILGEADSGWIGAPAFASDAGEGDD